MAGGQEKWYFTKEQLQNSASRKCGLDADKELAYRQQAANLIQDMGQRLQVSQLCINTAIVYMHRFYAFHSFTQFHRNAIAAAALFLAAKVEEQPRKLEYVIKVAHVCLHRGESVNGLTAEQYQEQAQELVFNENVLLQTLGFDVAIDHPHTHVVRTCHLVKAPKDLAQTSYFMASNSLHLTTMCLQYRPTVVACFCIHLASKWSNWAIPQSNEGRHWFQYVDRSVTTELLEKLTAEFLHIFDKCPSRLKRKMMTMSNSGSSPHSGGPSSSSQNSPFDKKHPPPPINDDFDKAFDKDYERERRRQPAPGGYVPATSAAPPPPPQKIDYQLYKEKREREERERRQHQRPARPGAPPGPAPGPPAAAHRPAAAAAAAAWPAKHEHRPRPPAPAAPVAPEPARTRPPSLFSPDNTTAPTAAAAAPRRPPPRPERPDHHRPPHARRPDPAPAPAAPAARARPRHHSSSEPELVPVVKKLDETPGFENVLRDQRPRPPRRPEPRSNGIETDPALVSNLLKESLARPAPITVPAARRSPDVPPAAAAPPPRLEPAAPPPRPDPAASRPDPAAPRPDPAAPPAADPPDHKHKKDKKKKDKHKHKDRDKSKEERKKHKKDKEKKRESSPAPAAAAAATAEAAGGANSDGALRITIPRDKLPPSPGLKIKIPKERLAAPPPPPHAPGLKIKISKDVLDGRKRAAPPAPGAPPHKLPRPPPHKVVDAPGVGNGHK